MEWWELGVIIYLDNGMEAVQANYTKFPLEEFNENPFIMALPPLEDNKNIIKKACGLSYT